MTEIAAPATDHRPAPRTPALGAPLACRELLDRHRERAALEGALASARRGVGGALVVSGEPGIGRTALLDYTMDNAQDMRVARVSGIEVEMGLGFAALHRLLLPWAAHLDRLPGPQRDALSAAFGQVTGATPHRFLVSLAALALLADVAADAPLLVTVDDAQWLDQATAEVLGFVARRLTAVPILFVIAVREPTNGCQPFDGLTELYLTRLREQDAHNLLARVVTGPLDPRTAARIVADTAGNPLAVVEFGRQLTGDQPTPVMPQPMPISGRLTGQFQRWIRTLPSGTQTMLLLAAAEPACSLAVLRRAADLLGLGPGAAQSAEAAGLLTYADSVTFRHPLVRSAVYHGALPRERRRVHRALASVTDLDRRAWHLAAATSEPDEQIAGELVQAAGRARATLDHAAEGMLLTRAAELTPDQTRRADRLIDGAAAELAAGAPARAEALLDQAAPFATSALARARTTQLRATIGLARGRFTDAPPALLHAARELHTTDLQLAQRTLLDAMYAALVAGPPANATAMLDVVHTARSWRPETPVTVEDLLLAGFTTRLTVGHRTAVPALRAAVTLLLTEPAGDRSPRLLALGCWAAGELLDGPALHALIGRCTATAGPTDHDSPDTATRDPAGIPGPAGLLRLAWLGDEADARPAIADSLLGSTDRGAGLAVTAAQHAIGILELGLGRYSAALTATLAVYRDDPPQLGTQVLPDLVEAAVRCGNRSAARSALQRFTERALAAGTPLGVALLDRCRALLTVGAEAESLYRQAIDGLEQTAETAQLARTHLLYGEWLRRQRRRRDARVQLRTARDLFDAAGFRAFAQRANGELLATGERASKRSGESDAQLTPQEMQVARLVAEGSSNREVAAQMFISQNTVEYHLQKVFRKAGVSSRTQLAVALLDPAHHPTTTALAQRPHPSGGTYGSERPAAGHVV
jgi:DNA-binding CsgD family transcriptional regulator